MRKLAIFLLLIVCVSCLGGGLSSAAFAASDDYTTALEDLQKDESFDGSNYPLISTDRSLSIIQIAESSARELFVYVYQPSGDLVTASSINICQDAEDASERHWYNYKLKQLSLEYTIGKYLVEGLTVRNAPQRIYDITSIYRYPIEGESSGSGDSVLPDGSITSEFSYSVASCFFASAGVNGAVTYSRKQIETIEVTNKYVNRLRYYQGWIPFVEERSTDSWFVAFDTDITIDRLIEADVYFVYLDCYKPDKFDDFYPEEHYDEIMSGDFTPPSYAFQIFVPPYSDDFFPNGDKQSTWRTLTYSDVVVSDKEGLFGKKYVWNRIESVKDFVNNEDLTDEIENNLTGGNYSWVLRFWESDYTASLSGTTIPDYARYSVVFDVTILRLKFETLGTVFNLGVVNNKVSHSGEVVPPANNSDNPFEKFFKPILDFFKGVGDAAASYWWLFVIIGILVLLAVLSIFFPVFRVVFKWIWAAIKWIFKILWYIISAPVRFVVWIVNKVKERKENSG